MNKLSRESKISMEHERLNKELLKGYCIKDLYSRRSVILLQEEHGGTIDELHAHLKTRIKQISTGDAPKTSNRKTLDIRRNIESSK